MNQIEAPNSRSPILFSNELTIGFSDNDCQLRFSVQGQPDAPVSHVAMTPKTAKLLARMLLMIIDDYEIKTGDNIPFDEGKLDGLIAQLANGANASSA